MARLRMPDANGCHTFKCATDLSAKQYMGTKLSAADTVAIADAHADLFVGVLMNKPDGTYNTGAQVACQPGMIVPAYAGAAIATVGTRITTDASGYFIGATDADICVGINITTAGAAGDIFEMLLTGPIDCANVSYYTAGS